MEDNNVGIIIKKYRKERKITQQELADMIGKSIETIKKYEKGSIMPPNSVIEQIADKLNVNPYDFIKFVGLENQSDYMVSIAANNILELINKGSYSTMLGMRLTDLIQKIYSEVNTTTDEDFILSIIGCIRSLQDLLWNSNLSDEEKKNILTSTMNYSDFLSSKTTKEGE